MLAFRDRVKDISTSTGSGDITLSGNSDLTFQSFNTAFGLNNQFLYCIVDNLSGLWETGVGRLSAATTMVREVVSDGSSGVGVAVVFTPGNKDVFCTVTSSHIQLLTTPDDHVIYNFTLAE